ncbi:hypothetical protein Dimus_002201 [Dionaea muscipula]
MRTSQFACPRKVTSTGTSKSKGQESSMPIKLLKVEVLRNEEERKRKLQASQAMEAKSRKQFFFCCWFFFLVILICILVVGSSSSSSSTLCNGSSSIAESDQCEEDEDHEMMLMGSEISRRILAETRYITVRAMNNNHPICNSGARGEPYSRNCLGQANRPTTGCDTYYGCRANGDL